MPVQQIESEVLEVAGSGALASGQHRSRNVLPEGLVANLRCAGQAPRLVSTDIARATLIVRYALWRISDVWQAAASVVCTGRPGSLSK